MMQFYYYRAFCRNGRFKLGFMFASDAKQLKYLLDLKGIRLISIKKIPLLLKVVLLRLFSLFHIHRVTRYSQSVFLRQIANLIEAGLSVKKTAESLVEQERNIYFLKVLAVLNESLSLGQSVGVSFKKAFYFLPEEHRLLLEGAHDTKSIHRVLIAIANLSSRKQHLTRSIVRMSIVFVSAFILSVFSFAYYVRVWLFDDRMSFFYRQTHPPALYEAFYQVFSGRFFLNWKYLIGVACFIALIILIRFLPRVQVFIKGLFLGVPVLGEAIRSRVASSLFFYLQLQVAAGQTLHQALKAGTAILSQSPFHTELNKLNNDLRNGISMKDALSSLRVFSADEKSLLLSSLSSHSLEESLQVICDYLESKSKTRTLVIREAVRFLLIAFMLLLYAWAIYTALYTTTGYAF